MNAWILMLMICNATPTADGSYCNAVPLQYGLSRQECQDGLQRWSRHRSKPKLECTEDPALVAELEEREADEELEPQEPATENNKSV